MEPILLADLFTFTDDYTKQRCGTRKCHIIKFPIDKTVSVTHELSRTPMATFAHHGQTLKINFFHRKWEMELAEFLGIDIELYEPIKVMLDNVLVLVDVYGDVDEDSLDQIKEQIRKKAKITYVE